MEKKIYCENCYDTWNVSDNLCGNCISAMEAKGRCLRCRKKPVFCGGLCICCIEHLVDFDEYFGFDETEREKMYNDWKKTCKSNIIWNDKFIFYIFSLVSLMLLLVFLILSFKSGALALFFAILFFVNLSITVYLHFTLIYVDEETLEYDIDCCIKRLVRENFKKVVDFYEFCKKKKINEKHEDFEIACNEYSYSVLDGKKHLKWFLDVLKKCNACDEVIVYPEDKFSLKVYDDFMEELDFFDRYYASKIEKNGKIKYKHKETEYKYSGYPETVKYWLNVRKSEEKGLKLFDQVDFDVINGEYYDEDFSESLLLEINVNVPKIKMLNSPAKLDGVIEVDVFDDEKLVAKGYLFSNSLRGYDYDELFDCDDAGFDVGKSKFTVKCETYCKIENFKTLTYKFKPLKVWVFEVDENI